MPDTIRRSVSGDGGRDDFLHEILRIRGWQSDRAHLPEEGDRFEWPPSIPLDAPSTPAPTVEGPNRFGTTIHVERFHYRVFSPQIGDQPAPARVCYSTRTELLQNIECIESWR